MYHNSSIIYMDMTNKAKAIVLYVPYQAVESRHCRYTRRRGVKRSERGKANVSAAGDRDASTVSVL